MRQKVDSQPDPHEKDGDEQRVDHLRDHLARPLREGPGLPGHDPGNEEPEERVNADPLSDRAAKHSEQRDERQCRGRLRHPAPLDPGNRRTRQSLSDGQADGREAGDSAQNHEDFPHSGPCLRNEAQHQREEHPSDDVVHR